MEQLFVIDSLQKIITPGFSIRQFKVENPTPFYIYLNLSTAVPTAINSQYVIQPNSTLVSPAVVTSDITVVPAGINVSKSIAKITVYDSAKQSAGNMPYQTSQFVGNFPNYPFTLAPSAGGLFELPSVTINQFQTVYIQMSGNPDLVNQPSLYPVLLCTKKDEGGGHITRTPIGIFMQPGGVVTYIPRTIPETVIFEVDTGSNSNYTKIFNIIQTSDPIDVNYSYPIITGFCAAAGGSNSAIGGGGLPGYLVSLDVVQSQAASINANFTWSVNKMLYNGNAQFVGFSNIFNQTLQFAMLTGQVYSVKPKLFLENQPCFVQVVVTNNTPSGGGLVGSIVMKAQARPIS